MHTLRLYNEKQHPCRLQNSKCSGTHAAHTNTQAVSYGGTDPKEQVVITERSLIPSKVTSFLSMVFSSLHAGIYAVISTHKVSSEYRMAED